MRGDSSLNSSENAGTRKKAEQKAAVAESEDKPRPREKRPFAQVLFCIDTRSERIRRHLEAVGDYQTFGIAGFFGVPVSFMELGKGSEIHLCPILLTPKNLVLEITREETLMDEAALSALEKAIHELKESIFSPFVTVEAIGLLFGFDMLGKTLAPRTYNGLRKHLHSDKPITYLLQDKLSREQADCVVRAVQRAVIESAVEHDLHLPKERITDDMVLSAAYALADAQRLDMPPNGERVTNLMLATENLADHFTHFYLFFMPDFARQIYRQESWFYAAQARFKAVGMSMWTRVTPLA